MIQKSGDVDARRIASARRVMKVCFRIERSVKRSLDDNCLERLGRHLDEDIVAPVIGLFLAFIRRNSTLAKRSMSGSTVLRIYWTAA